MSRATRARFGDVADAAFRTWHDRNAERLRGALGLDLVAHDADVLGGRADELDVVLVEDLGEAGILREKAVARMHGLGAGDLAGRHDGRDVEIAVARRRRADAHALIGQAHMHRLFIRGRMDGDRLDAELAAGAQHAQRDLAAIGDEDFVEHRLLDHHQRFAILDRLAVLDEDLRDLAGARRRDLVHRLHRLDDEQRLAFA